MHLDKRREPIPCPGSHTGAADSVPLRTRRRISAQRGLKIRGLNESAGSGPGEQYSNRIYTANFGHYLEYKVLGGILY